MTQKLVVLLYEHSTGIDEVLSSCSELVTTDIMVLKESMPDVDEDQQTAHGTNVSEASMDDRARTYLRCHNDAALPNRQVHLSFPSVSKVSKRQYKTISHSTPYLDVRLRRQGFILRLLTSCDHDVFVIRRCVGINFWGSVMEKKERGEGWGRELVSSAKGTDPYTQEVRGHCRPDYTDLTTCRNARNGKDLSHKYGLGVLLFQQGQVRSESTACDASELYIEGDPEIGRKSSDAISRRGNSLLIRLFASSGDERDPAPTPDDSKLWSLRQI
ncbi:hypothetical protein HD554DRAFT_2041661 [Boletus coccyginus]|nr:hypothetical protein HD554DRAFT_2041661 [Boletus coccyginus]